ncbi:hypothetical protein DNTS_026635 [Danionella cerebrum]|uniref:G-protein coupled receptors family 1 profile domain-containing protein n=1 Tax=Danionella cerebrum TaxID=2873325 RepID=A0A553RE88_9TELE|nr:hypothetical protein DNTS_026635 [Danionella translucida]
MDALNPEDTINDYEDYYSLESTDGHGLCKKTHVKKFSLTFLPIFYNTTCAFGIVANSILLFLVTKHKTLRKLLPLQMIISDILFTLSLPFWAAHAGSLWVFGYHGCKAITLVYMVNLYSSNLFIASLQMFTSTKRNVILSITVWLSSILAAAVHVNFVEIFQEENTCTYQFKDNHEWKLYLRFQMIVVGFLIPFLIMLISLPLRYCVTTMRMNSYQVCRVKFGFTVMFFLLWFPYTLVIFLLALQDIHVFHGCAISIHFDLAIHVTESIAFMHVFLNPLVYMFLNKKVWKRLKNMCKSQREYLLEESSSSSDQDGDIELKSVQRCQASSAERPNNFLPEPK